MPRYESIAVGGGRRVRVATTDRTDGDFAIADPDGGLAARRRHVVDEPWTWLRQVHGAGVLRVAAPGDGAGTEADAAVTDRSRCPLAVMTADCAPVVLVGDTAVGVVHAGWRGLVAGVIEATAAGLAALGATPVATLLGPCIDPSSYEFGPEDLDRVEAALGPTVRSVTAWGTPALDVPAAVAAACERTGWPIPATPPSSTADERWYSHRLRAEPQRLATVAWLEEVR